MEGGGEGEDVTWRGGVVGGEGWGEGGELFWDDVDNWEYGTNGWQIQPGNIEVSSVASKVYNGEVWILKGVRNYAS